MGLGLDLEVKNSRYHTAMDLTSNKDIKEILSKSISTKNCHFCQRLFDFHNHQFVCRICLNVICEKCCISEYYYDNVNDPEKDMLECRCKSCYNFIRSHETTLSEAIKSNILNDIVSAFDRINSEKIKIDCKLAVEASREILRLQTEKKINEYLNSLKYVENHKTIIKSLSVLEDMLIKSNEENIVIDPLVIEVINNEKKRLIAEKELRYSFYLIFQLYNIDNYQ